MRRLPLAATVAVFFVAKLTTNVGTRFVYAFLPAIARGLGVSVSTAGWLASARWGVGALTPAMVRLAGREHRRRILLTGAVLFTAGAAVTALFGVLAGAIVGFVLMGLGKPLLDTGVQAVTADRIPYATRARTIGLLETTWALGFLVGAPVAGWLIQSGGWEAPFLAVAAAGALVTLPLALTASAEAGRHQPAGRLRLEPRSRAFLLAAVLIAGSAEIVFITFAAWLEDDHGFGLAGLAVLATVLGVAELMAEGATAVFTDRLGKSRAVALGMAISAAGFAGLALGSQALPVALASLVAGIAGFEFAIVSSISLATELVPEMRVQYLSRMVVAQALGRAAAAVAGLFVFAAAGIAGVGAAAAITAAGAATILHSRVREHEAAAAAGGPG